MSAGPVESRDPEAVMVMEALQACLDRIEAGDLPADALRAVPDPALRARLATLIAPTVALHAGAALPEPRRTTMRGSLAALAADLYPPAATTPSTTGPKTTPTSSTTTQQTTTAQTTQTSSTTPPPTAPDAGSGIGGWSQSTWTVGIVAAVGAGAILLAAILRPGSTPRIDAPAPGMAGVGPGAPSSGLGDFGGTSASGRSERDGVTPPLGDVDSLAPPVAPVVGAEATADAEAGADGVAAGNESAGNESADGASATSGRDRASVGSPSGRDRSATPATSTAAGRLAPAAGDTGAASTTQSPSAGSIPPAASNRDDAVPTCLSAPVERPGAAAGSRSHVVGRVVDSGCNPVADAIVVFSPAAGDVEILARTEPDGTFAVTIERGDYDVALDADAAIAGAWVDRVRRPLGGRSGAVAVSVGPPPGPRVDFMLTGGAP